MSETRRIDWTIELSENSVQILNKQELDENSVVFVSVDIGHMAAARAHEYMVRIKEEMVKILAPAKVVIHAENLHISVVTQKQKDLIDI